MNLELNPIILDDFSITNIEAPIEPIIPESVIIREPDESVGQEPVTETLIAEEPVETEPEKSVAEEQEEPVTETPIAEEPVETEPEKSVATEPEEPVVAEPEESVVVEQEESVVAEPEEPVVQEPVTETPIAEKSVVVEQEEPVVVEPEEPVVAEQEEPVVVEPEEPVVAEQEEPVVVEPEEPVVAEQEEPVVAEQEEPVVAEQEEPVVEEQEDPVVVEQEEPVVVEQEDPVVEELYKFNNIQFVLEEHSTCIEPEIVFNNKIPEIVFIIPYRDRETEKRLFLIQMDKILSNEEKSKSRIFFIEQYDTRTFNRGAMKNIGFIIVKQLYPDNYKDITIVFNDIDTMPTESGLIDYKTVTGNIKHFYGYLFTLGGIISITGQDFERLNGFPNYWAWGFEDNMLNKRAKNAKITIDRSQFYHIHDPKITQFKGPVLKNVNRSEFDRYVQQNPEGIRSIKNLEYTQLTNEPYIEHILIKNFLTEYNEDINNRAMHDLRTGASPFNVGYSGKKRATIGMVM